IRIANHLGVEVIVVHGGDIRKSYTKAYVNTLKHLRELKPIAENSGVKLVIENLFEGKIGALPHELLSFANEGFELCFDIGHAFLTSVNSGLRMDEFSVLFPYTSHLHIHDNNGYEDEHRPLGEGMIGFSYAGRVVELTKA
ncbi:sugar phosphate isomerase/epimerase, partial [Thermococcus sp. GR7]|uniref:TIM barrel protein n=1 Tax=Thermococcus sp. GR7 TaxID=1638257 RepID=UPI0014321824